MQQKFGRIGAFKILKPNLLKQDQGWVLGKIKLC